METALGLLGILVFIAAVISIAAGVTLAVVKLSPAKDPKESKSASEAR